MTGTILFLHQGWKNIWKQRIIWFFSVLKVLQLLFNFNQVKRSTDLLTNLVFLVLELVFTGLSIVGAIGIPYIAYNLLIGKFVTTSEVFSAVRKFFGRALGCSCLSLLAASPLLVWILATSINIQTRTLEIPNKVSVGLLFFSIFNALWYFTLSGFFKNNWGIRKSFSEAWLLFINHFGALAILGLLVAVVSRAYYTLSGVLTVLFQSGFTLTALSTLNVLNPSISLGKNFLFVLINSVGYVMFFPLSASIFIAAYLKYNNQASDE